MRAKHRGQGSTVKVPPGDSCTRTGTITSWNRGESCGICRVVPRSRTVWSVATTRSSCTPRPPARDVPTHAMKAGLGSVARPLTRLLCGGRTSSVRYRFAAARSVRPPGPAREAIGPARADGACRPTPRFRRRGGNQREAPLLPRAGYLGQPTRVPVATGRLRVPGVGAPIRRQGTQSPLSPDDLLPPTPTA